MADGGARTAITLKIPDAFFYDYDWKLGFDMYGEVLSRRGAGECGRALVNQVLSDIAPGDFEQAAAHIRTANGEMYEKSDAIGEDLFALKCRGMCDEALTNLDSLRLWDTYHRYSEQHRCLELCTTKITNLISQRSNSYACVAPARM